MNINIPIIKPAFCQRITRIQSKKPNISEDKFKRAVDVAKRLIDHANQLKEEKKKKQRDRIIFLIVAIALCVLTATIFRSKPNVIVENRICSDLFAMFESKDVSPYILTSNTENTNDFCPCIAFEGEWELTHNYKFPLKSDINGLHYLAKSSNARFKCARNGALPFVLDGDSIKQGQKFYGLEILENEIWYDRLEKSVDNFIIKKDGKKKFTPEYNDFDFNSDKNKRFTRIATIQSYFFNEFIISQDSIKRYGDHLGRRYIELDTMQISNWEKEGKTVDLDLNQLIGDFKMTNCHHTVNPYPNPDSLQISALLSFDCYYMQNQDFKDGIPYTKTYKFTKQSHRSGLDCE